ncbi:MAG: hypothetical protein HY319_13910 [Armatimonadetes bacterium]|nr:hypothetical protein [Armatimonadota bacterium]
MLALGTQPAAGNPVIDYYQTKTLPRAQWSLEEPVRDAKELGILQIPAIVAILKCELATGNWPKTSLADRKQLVAILNDPKMKFVYTGRQSTLAHASGAQAIDKTTCLFHQDGFFLATEPREAHVIARHILHEVGHVHQLRHNYLPRPGSTKEWFPEELEAQLSPSNFMPEKVAEVTAFLEGRSASPPPQAGDRFTAEIQEHPVDGGGEYWGLREETLGNHRIVHLVQSPGNNPFDRQRPELSAPMGVAAEMGVLYKSAREGAEENCERFRKTGR